MIFRPPQARLPRRAPDPLADARTLLALARLLYRARDAARAFGVEPAAQAVRVTVPIGRRLATAVEAAERATTEEERGAALAAVVRAREELAATVGPWEGVGGLICAALAGIRPPDLNTGKGRR